MKYRYKVIRSNRKSVSIDVSVENEITVRAPWSMHIDELEAFVDSKAEWIYKVVNANATAFYDNSSVVYFKEALVDGKKLPLEIGEKNLICDDKVCLKNLSDICATYTEKFYPRLKEQVEKLAAETKTYPASVSVKAYKGRWGCCDPRNNLIFNFLIFMLPPRLQKYVVVHELCHTVCHNHSAGFWKLVSDYLPDYKKLKNELKYFDFLTTLY